MIFKNIKELNDHLDGLGKNKAEKFSFLKENKEEIIALKKKAVKFSEVLTKQIDFVEPKAVVKKNETTQQNKGKLQEDTSEVLYRKIVGNTSWWMDFDNDVITDKSWNRTLKSKRNIKFLKNHEYKLESIIGQIKQVQMQEFESKDLRLQRFTKNKIQSLVAEVEIDKILNNQIFSLYQKGLVDQHSVGMQYVDLELAINDDGKDFEEEKQVFDKNIDRIINKKEAIDIGFFWLVKESSLHEISAVVMGSNEITPTLESKDKDIETTKKEIKNKIRLAFR